MVQLIVGDGTTWFEQVGALTGIGANIVTIFGVSAIALAWVSYVSAVKNTRESHMSGMFRDYLRMAFEFHNSGERGDDHPAYEFLADYKTWVLEEVWRWLETLRSRWASEKTKRTISDWEQSIIYQFHKDDTCKLYKDFDESRLCYQEKFREFMDKWHPWSPHHFERTKGDCPICREAGWKTKPMVAPTDETASSPL